MALPGTITTTDLVKARSYDVQGFSTYVHNKMSRTSSVYEVYDNRRTSKDMDRGASPASTVMDDSRRTSKTIDEVDLEKEDLEKADLEKALSPNENLTLRERIKHFTWAWYTTTMATGGLALLISATPHRFKGLSAIGAIIFAIDLILFLGITSTILFRFIVYPGLLKKTLLHRRESLLFATFWLSIATIINNTQVYIGPIMVNAYMNGFLLLIRVAFWVYTTCTFFVAVGLYYTLFTQRKEELLSITPAWLLPIFPIMLVGTVASSIAGFQPPGHSLPILVAGLTCQGLGFFVALAMYALWLGRLMSVGLPHGRPGMFIAVGPPSFTALALIGMANDAAKVFPQGFDISDITNTVLVIDVLRIVALLIAIFLWTLGLWFFFITAIAVIAGIPTGGGFHLSWWTFVFPNVGFTIALINIGKALGSEAILWVTSIMTIMLVCMWGFVVFNQIKAVLTKKIMWPERDEDYDE